MLDDGPLVTWRTDDTLAAGWRRRQCAAVPQPARAADRDAAGSAGDDREGVQLAGRPRGAAGTRAGGERARGLRPGGASRDLRPAARVQDLCRLIAERYDGDAEQVWAGARSGAELLKRVAELPGFGAQKAQIFVALLGKQLGVRPKGWREAAGPFGDKSAYRSVADIVDAPSLARVRAYKQQLKAAAKAGA